MTLAVTAFTAMLPDVRAQIPAVTMMSFSRSARRVARDFCKETQAFEYDLTGQVTFDAALLVGTVTLPADTEISQLQLVKINGEDIPFTSYRDAALNMRGRQGVYLTPPNMLVFQTPVMNTLTGFVALKPVYNAVSMPTAIFSRYYETLQYGVMADLYAANGTAWFNPQLAGAMGQMYAMGVQAAKAEAARDNVFKSSVARYHN